MYSTDLYVTVRYMQMKYANHALFFFYYFLLFYTGIHTLLASSISIRPWLDIMIPHLNLLH
jgi:hypothetical protein